MSPPTPRWHLIPYHTIQLEVHNLTGRYTLIILSPTLQALIKWQRIFFRLIKHNLR